MLSHDQCESKKGMNKVYLVKQIVVQALNHIALEVEGREGAHTGEVSRVQRLDVVLGQVQEGQPLQVPGHRYYHRGSKQVPCGIKATLPLII